MRLMLYNSYTKLICCYVEQVFWRMFCCINSRKSKISNFKCTKKIKNLSTIMMVLAIYNIKQNPFFFYKKILFEPHNLIGVKLISSNKRNFRFNNWSNNYGLLIYPILSILE